MTFYHGTSDADARNILKSGIDVMRSRSRDPGDFGWGFYLTSDRERAESFGVALLEVIIDPSRLAQIPNPYFLSKGKVVEPVTEVERHFHALVFTPEGEMTTVQGRIADREAAARQVRDSFLRAGYNGIQSTYVGDETVLFDPSAVQHVRLLPTRLPSVR